MRYPSRLTARASAAVATPLSATAGQPSGSRLIRMAPWFDDGLLSVQVAGRYYYEDAAKAHRLVEQGHTRGKLVLIVDDALAREWEV